MTGEDKVVTWLPLYHDMGLIAGFHLPLIVGTPIIQIDAFQWISAPHLLFEAITQEKATLTWLPNFAYNFLADRVREDQLENIKFDSMRMFINCSEVVRAESHDKFIARFKGYGLKESALSSCYAMAEATFAVTQTEPGRKPSTYTLESSRKTGVSSGKPVKGCRLRIIDAEGKELPEDHVGRIMVQSVSLFDGYKNNPERTRAVLKDGWYSSGDIGFCHGGEYYILGREDDMIIIAGKNIYPEDIESVIDQILRCCQAALLQ